MDKATINEIIQYLREQLITNGVKVDSIAIFGSALTDEMHEDSDVDLIIISTDFKDKDLFERCRITMKPEIDTLKKFKIPMDVINLSPDEYNETKVKMRYQSKIVA